MVDLEGLKRHLRLPEGDTEDSYLRQLILVATDYLTGLTGHENDGEQPIYEQAAYLLIAHYYANRSLASDVQFKTIPYGFSALVAQIRPVDGFF